MKISNNAVIPANILNYKYFPHILAGSYFTIMSVIAYSFHKIGDYGVETDFYWTYIPQAKDFLKGILTIDNYKGPIYQIILGLFSTIFSGDFFKAGIFLSLISASIILFLVFKIIKLISNNEIAFLTVIFIATNKFFIKYSYSCCTDMVFMVFYFVSVLYLLKSNFTDKKYLFIAGFFCSIAYLTRYTALSLIIAFILFLLILFVKALKNKNKNLRIEIFLKLKRSYLFLIPNVLITIIWGIFCLTYKGSFFYNDNYLNTAYTVYKPEEMGNIEWINSYQKNFHSFFDVFINNTGLFIKRIFIENFGTYIFKDMYILLPWYLGIFTIIGLIIVIIKYKELSSSIKIFFFLCFIFYLFPIMIFYSERFSLPLLPFYFYLMLTVLFIKSQNKDTKKIPKNKKSNTGIAGITESQIFKSVVIAIFVIINIYIAYSYVKDNFSKEPREIFLAADWSKKHFDELNGKKLMARKPHLAYYTNSIFVSCTSALTIDELWKNIKKSDTDYLYVSSKEWDYQTIKIFLNDLQKHPELMEAVYGDKEYSCVLYKVKK